MWALERDAAKQGCATAAPYSSVQIPGDSPSSAAIQLEGELCAWQFSRGLQLQVSGCPARCTAFAVQDRDLTLLPASPSSCPSLTLFPSLLTMENMLTSTN